jgi:hypothetical protein
MVNGAWPTGGTTADAPAPQHAIQAEAASVLYELDASAFAQLKDDNPPLVEKLLSYVVAVLAERLVPRFRSS